MESNLARLCSIFPTSALSYRESMWLTKGCLERFLTACSNDVGLALTKLITAINWRNMNNVWDILQPNTKDADLFRSEASSGKLYVVPKPDKHGRAIVVYKARMQSQRRREEQLRFVLYTMERACHVAGEQKIILILDCSEVTLRSVPAFSFINSAIRSLTLMYPERLATVLVFNASLIIRLSIAAVFNLLPCLVREKLFFSKLQDSLIPILPIDPVDWTSIPYEYQGRSPYTFSAEAYLDLKPPKVFPRSEFVFRIA